jgi:cysteine desulfuration protein SufE
VSSGPEARPDPIEELAAIPDPQERLGWIVDRGRRAPVLPVDLRTAAHRVPGCVSAVWLVDESQAGTCRFRADAEAPILRGLAALICERANGRPAAEVAADETDLLAAIKLDRHLTPTRANGLRMLQAHLRRLAAGTARNAT